MKGAPAHRFQSPSLSGLGGSQWGETRRMGSEPQRSAEEVPPPSSAEKKKTTRDVRRGTGGKLPVGWGSEPAAEAECCPLLTREASVWL